MTISTTGLRVSYSGNGVTTDFSFPYKFLADEDLIVTLIDADGVETTQVLNTDYTVSGEGTASGTVAMVTPPTSTETLLIVRELEITQEVDYITGGPFPAETHEGALDRLTMIAQQLSRGVDLSLKISEADSEGVSTLLPPPESNNYIKWNATGTGFENTTGTVDFQGAAFIETQTLISGQTQVTFTNDITTGSFYLTGPDCDNGRLLAVVDYTLNTATNTVVLTQSYPAGTNLTLAYYDITESAETGLTGVIAYTTLTDLRGAYTYTDAVAYLKEDGRAGTFKWDSSDLSTEVAADTQSGIYVAPSSDLTGASGAWVRQYNTLNSSMFGITGSPEGVITAPVGKLFLRTDGGLSTTLYVKESGTGNTGWVAK